MKTIFKMTLTTILVSSSLSLAAQTMPEAKKLTEFSFMIGSWQGTGTHYSQQGTQQFQVDESIEYATNGTTLLIKGLGTNQQGEKQHDALGVLYYENGGFYMHAFTMQGHAVIADVTLTGEKSFEWGFELPSGGKIKYSASYTETTWEESGTYTTPDGNQSFPTVKMSLIKSEM